MHLLSSLQTSKSIIEGLPLMDLLPMTQMAICAHQGNQVRTK